MNAERTGYCSNGFYGQLQATPPVPLSSTPRFPGLDSTLRTHFPSHSVAVEQQENMLQLLSSRQEQSNSQVQAIVSRLTAMETHLKDITNSMAQVNQDNSLPASRSRQRVSASVSVSLLFAPVWQHCMYQWHYNTPTYVYAYAEKGEGTAFCSGSSVLAWARVCSITLIHLSDIHTHSHKLCIANIWRYKLEHNQTVVASLVEQLHAFRAAYQGAANIKGTLRSSC